MIKKGWKSFKNSMIENGWKKCSDCDGVESPMIDEAGTIRIFKRPIKNGKKLK
jgi:hypothetical protein